MNDEINVPEVRNKEQEVREEIVRLVLGQSKITDTNVFEKLKELHEDTNSGKLDKVKSDIGDIMEEAYIAKNRISDVIYKFKNSDDLSISDTGRWLDDLEDEIDSAEKQIDNVYDVLADLAQELDE